VLNGSELALQNFPARQSVWAAGRQSVRAHLYLYHFVWDLVQEARLSRRAVEPGTGVPFDYRLYEEPVDPEWDRAWTITAALLRELQVETARDGARLMVAAVTNDLRLHPDHREQMFDQYPAMRDMRWDWAQTHRRLGEICAANGIAFLDFMPPFLAAAEREPTTHLHSFGGHWTKAGHRLAAEVLDEYLRSGAAPAALGRGLRGLAEPRLQ